MVNSGKVLRRLVPVAAAAALLVGVASCSSDTAGTASPAPGSAPVAATGAANATASASMADTVVTTEYTATSEQVTGDTGRVRYDVTLPQVEGGDPRVAKEFNESMRAALQDQIDGSGAERFTLDGRDESRVAIGSRVLAGLLLTSWDANPPGAHSSPLLATVVIDADNAQPITLGALFPNLQAGLNRLSQESARLLPATAAGEGYDRSGIEATEANFANWIPTPAGMEIHFVDYQVGPHGAGLIVVTVPWDRLTDVISPAMLEVVRS